MSASISPTEYIASDAHTFYELSGSAHEIGQRQGQIFKGEIVREFQPALTRLCERLGGSEARVLDRYRALYEPLFQKLAPRAIEEIEGLADGAELSYEQAFFAAIRDGAKAPYVTPRHEGCTAFYCGPNTTRGGRVLIGQTKDTSAPLSRYQVLQLHYDDGLSVLTLKYPGWNAHIGVSSYGLGNIGNSLYAASPRSETAPFSLLKRLVMERKNVQDVLDAIADLTFENGCFMMADEKTAVCLEFVAGQRSQRDVSKQAFGHANSILDPGLKTLEEYSANPSSDMASSDFRQKNIQRWLDDNKGNLDVETLKNAVADHEDFPNSICRHAPCGESRTTAAFIADLTARKAHICIGNPCSRQYREYSV